MDSLASALIGHLLVSGLLACLVDKKVITQLMAADVVDDALLQLEMHQVEHPEGQRAFEDARAFLEDLARGYKSTD